MPKRDYKSYNVLGEELAQEGNYEENQYIDAVSSNKSESRIEENLQVGVIEATPAGIGKLNIEEEQEDSMGKVAVHPQKKINLGKKLKKNKETDLNKSVELTNNIDFDKNINSNEHVDKNIGTDKNIDVHNYEDKSSDINKNVDKNKEVDMTFSAYKTQYQTKERSKLVKWSMLIAKLILIIMLLPLIAIISCVVLGFLGGFLTAITTAIGTGVIILGAICFMSTQVSASLIALGIAAAVTCISLGGILLILFCMLMKWVSGLLRKYKKAGSQKHKKGEKIR